MSARSMTGKPEDFFLLWCNEEPRIVNASVQLNPMGRIEQYAISLRLPNNQVVGFYSNNLEEAKLRITKKIDSWYNEAISERKSSLKRRIIGRIDDTTLTLNDDCDKGHYLTGFVDANELKDWVSKL